MITEKDLDEYVILLNRATIANETFAEIVNRGMELFNISNADVAHRFDMSRPSVARWKSGRSVPHPFMRKHIVEYFRSLLFRAYEKHWFSEMK